MSIPTPADERTPDHAGTSAQATTTDGDSRANASTADTHGATIPTGITSEDLIGTPIGTRLWRNIAGIPEPAPEGWVRRKPTRAERRTDVVLGLILAIAMALSEWSANAAGVYGDLGESALWVRIAYPSMALIIVSFRRRTPIIALLVATVVFIGGFLIPYHELFFTQMLYFAVFYSAGAWSRHRNASAWVRLIVAGGTISRVMLGIVVSIVMSEPIDLPTPTANTGAYAVFIILANFTYYVGAYVLGNIDYVRTGHAALATEQARVLREQRTKLADQAVKLDRVRIARELHDAVAHHVSLMGLQAAVARRSLPAGEESARAREQLEAVEANAREAIEELQGILATLRASESDTGMVPVVGAEPDHRTVSPSTRGVAQLPELVEQLRQAGMSLSFATVGDPQPLTQSADLSAYRIVQEALTNVRKHAGASATAEVRLRYGRERLEIDVTDDGFGPIGGANASTNVELASGGRGILGMRERASAVGGTLEAGPRPDGGFRVRASLPLKGSRGLG